LTSKRAKRPAGGRFAPIYVWGRRFRAKREIPWRFARLDGSDLGLRGGTPLGDGYGRALLERVITRSQTRGLPLLLDTMKPENLTFYERFGFEVIGRYPLSRGYNAWAMRLSA
jgi:GNAT superfamily N-acetyltransferase